MFLISSKRKNVSEIPIEIDLHGETVKDAILKLDDFFQMHI